MTSRLTHLVLLSTLATLATTFSPTSALPLRHRHAASSPIAARSSSSPPPAARVRIIHVHARKL